MEANASFLVPHIEYSSQLVDDHRVASFNYRFTSVSLLQFTRQLATRGNQYERIDNLIRDQPQ